MTGVVGPGRSVSVNTAIALGGSVFSDGANIKSQSGTALGAYAGGYVGEYFPVILRPALGNSASAVGDIGGGFVSELINYGIKNYPTPINRDQEQGKKPFILFFLQNKNFFGGLFFFIGGGSPVLLVFWEWV
ncbi:hypothetical protein ACISSW_28590, partial [Escherichia coli]